MTGPSIRRQAPGKVNLFFAVGPRRADGYHAVASLYVATDVCEAVTVTFIPELPPGQVECTVEVKPGSLVAQQQQHGSFSLAQIPRDTTNLAVRAVGSVIDNAGGLPGGVHVHLEKAVPVAGGMGGGSADAAAALQATVELVSAVTGHDMLACDALDIARGLGADVPFAMTGGAAIGTGTGTELVSVPVAEPWAAVLIADDGALSTPAVFSRLDDLRGRGELLTPDEQSLTVPEQLLDALAGYPPTLDRVVGCLRNDLQNAAIDLAPHLASRLRELQEAGTIPMVSGSGPTLIALTPNQVVARRLAHELRKTGAHAVPTMLG